MSAATSRSVDLLLLESSSGLRSMGVGSKQSTFLGLAEMRDFAKALRPAAEVHLWVRPAEVVFELSVRVTVVSAPSPAGDARASDALPTLPRGLAFVCCDDDEIPRLFAPVLLAAASADVDESVVLGETYEEVATLVDRVVAMGRRLVDPSRVVCVLDQNLDSYEKGVFTGTDLVREMRRRGFDGLVIIQSANDELEDERDYTAAGADGSVGKAVQGGAQTMLAVLSRLWHQRFGEAHRLPAQAHVAPSAARPQPIMQSPEEPSPSPELAGDWAVQNAAGWEEERRIANA